MTIKTLQNQTQKATLFSLLLCISTASAKLQWTQPEQEKIYHQAGPIKFEFEFQNIGNEPLEITTIQPECGCTEAYTTTPTIEPQQKATITAVTDTKKVGPISTNQILIKDNKKNEYVLTLTTRKDAGYILVPQELAWTQSNTNTQTITLHRKPNRRFEIKSIQPLNSNLTTLYKDTSPNSTTISVTPKPEFSGTSAVRITLQPPPEESNEEEIAWIRVRKENPVETKNSEPPKENPLIPTTDKEMQTLLEEKLDKKH